MGKKWSASKVSTFSDCPLKYKYSYVEGWKRYPDSSSELASKGLAFHETAEMYHTGMAREEALKILNDKIKLHNVDTTKYKEFDALDNFLLFWEQEIAPKENELTVKKESWVNGNILRQPFCGALDLLLENDNKVIIYDYKSGSKANISGYKNQLILYAYLKGQEHGWTKEEIVEKTEIYVFFPFSQVEGEATISRMEKCVKAMKFTEADLNSVIQDFYASNISKIQNTNWEEITPSCGNLHYGCSYCPFAGAKANDKGFGGCQKTVDAGIEFPEESFIAK